MRAKRVFSFAISFVVPALLASCGVRGRPQPPLTPAELGKGKPTFQRATEDFAFPSVPEPGVTAEPTATPPKKASERKLRDDN
jgi:hypothetical protein